MLLTKTARSSTLKLALIYIILFSAAIFGLLAYVHWSAVAYLEHDLEHSIRAEQRVLIAAYDRAGRQGLISAINQRVGDARLSGWYYALADKTLAPLAGNLPGWPEPKAAIDSDNGGWSPLRTLDIARKPATPRRISATHRRLTNGDYLLIGRQRDSIDGFAAQTATAVGITAALFLLLAAAAGISTARRSVTRIETINATSREIIGAGFGRRIPLRGTGDEWDELATNLNAMLDRIEELAETNRQVSDNIAHDLRTPLTRMRSRLERAEAQGLDIAGYQTLVSAAIAELDAVLRTFSSLLRISRIEASDRSSGLPCLDLNMVAAEVVELFDAVADEAAVRLTLAAGQPAQITGDRDLLIEAIANLVDNAIKHGGAGGVVCVAVSRDGEGPRVSVTDRGPGVPADECQQVFKRFYRLERSRNSPGNGLGLSLVAAVAHLHGATVHLSDNAPGLRVDFVFSSGAAASSPSRYGALQE